MGKPTVIITVREDGYPAHCTWCSKKPVTLTAHNDFSLTVVGACEDHTGDLLDVAGQWVVGNLAHRGHEVPT